MKQQNRSIMLLFLGLFIGIIVILKEIGGYHLLVSYIVKTALILSLFYGFFIYFFRHQLISTFLLSKQDINQILPLWRETYKNTRSFISITKSLLFIAISFYAVSIITNWLLWTLFIDYGFSMQPFQFLSGIVAISLHITVISSFILAFLLITPLRWISSLMTALIEARIKKHYPELYDTINTTPYDGPLINTLKKKGREWLFGSSSRPFQKNWRLYTRTISPLPKEIEKILRQRNVILTILVPFIFAVIFFAKFFTSYMHTSMCSFMPGNTLSSCFKALDYKSSKDCRKNKKKYHGKLHYELKDIILPYHLSTYSMERSSENKQDYGHCYSAWLSRS